MEASPMTQTEQTSNAISNSPDQKLSNDAITPAHADQPVDAVEIAPSDDAGEVGGAVDTSLKDMIDTGEVKRALEAALLAASEPLGLNELRRLFEGQLGPEVIRNLLDELRTGGTIAVLNLRLLLVDTDFALSQCTKSISTDCRATSRSSIHAR